MPAHFHSVGTPQRQHVRPAAPVVPIERVRPHHPEARFQTPEELIAACKSAYRKSGAAGLRFDALLREVQSRTERKEALDREAYALSPGDATMDILFEVALAHRVTIADIKGPRRQRYILAARWEAISRLRAERPHLSLVAIGRILNRDHTSILNALRKMETCS